MKTHRPFDAVLVLSFGGPGGPEEVRPFLANVLRGRQVAPGRIEQVAARYQAFGGVSPITQLTYGQARGLEARLAAAGLNLPVYVGMRNWRPLLADTLAEMAGKGVGRAIGFIAAAYGCYSSCGQYKLEVANARRVLRQRGPADVQVTYVDPWFEHQGFIEANACHIEAALAKLDPGLREQARIVFTAHSIPASMAQTCHYEDEIARSCRAVMRRLGRKDWALAYQSRSGRPADPWLGPDINDYLRAEAAAGLQAVVIAPIGFLCDHVEILYDLDCTAAGTCRELGLPVVRAEAVNDDPLFLDTMSDCICRTWARYDLYPPLPITGGGPSEPENRHGGSSHES